MQVEICVFCRKPILDDNFQVILGNHRIHAQCESDLEKIPVQGSIDFGKHRGKPWTRVDSGYLSFIFFQTDRHADRAIAVKELIRRGYKESHVQIGSFILDFISLNFLDYWEKQRKEKEGLFSWMERIVQEGLIKGEVTEKDNDQKMVHFEGFELLVGTKFTQPVLKSVKLQK